MNRWLTYAKERFPVSTYALLVGGFTSSGCYVTGQPVLSINSTLSFFGLFLFFGLLRLMDEYKDFDKDKVAHPERPLPRGLIKLEEAQTAIQKGIGIQILFSLLLLTISLEAVFIYGFITVYLYLMYREFFVGHSLQNYPLIYAITHQLILIPLCIFTVVVQPGGSIDLEAFYYGIFVLGSFFTYEISRKLNPNDPAILKNYRSLYGWWGCALIIVGLSGIAFFGSLKLNLFTITVFPLGLVALSLLFQKHKWVEGAATLSLLIHLYAFFLQDWLSRFI